MPVMEQPFYARANVDSRRPSRSEYLATWIILHSGSRENVVDGDPARHSGRAANRIYRTRDEAVEPYFPGTDLVSAA